MLLDQRLEQETVLQVPESLQPRDGQMLPYVTAEVLDELHNAGWSRVGLMVAFVDSEGNVLMLEHNGRDKNHVGALGPMGETSQHAGPIIEQPMETLFRGIQEELGIQQPADLEFWMHKQRGWVINQWPRGNGYAGEFACAIAFPVFVPDSAKQHLLDIPHGTEEVGGLKFLPVEVILSIEDGELRPGVKGWLQQMDQAGLFAPDAFGSLEPVDFSAIYGSSLRDIEL